MKLNVLLSGTAISTIAVASAFAQTPPRAPVPAAQPFSWTGFYLGGHVGAARHYSRIADPMNAFFAGIAGTGPEYDFSRTATVYGFHGGYNWQWSWVVLGVEGDFSTALSNKRVTVWPSLSVVTSDFSEMYSVRGRIGAAFDRLLVYGTAGWAGAELTSRIDDVPNPFVAVRTTNPSGPIFGGGLEYAVTGNWLVRAEYFHIHFPDQMIITPSGGGGTYQFLFRDSIDVVRGGISYKF
jgi:outer membrane immunogenic protein